MNLSKKFFTLVLCASLFLMGCNDDKSGSGSNINTGSVTDIDLDKVMKSPYSTLKPEEQKVKLEQECIDFLNELQAANSLKAIEVFENFIDLLELDTPDVDEPTKEASSTKSIFDVTLTYGVFTWNASGKEWKKTNSSSELKFVFPAKGRTGNNNASLLFKATNGATITDKYEDWDNKTYTDEIHLPKSVSGILSVDSKEIAKIEANAEYQKMDKIENDKSSVEGSYPIKTQYKMTTTEGYVYWYSVDGKGKDSKVEMQLSKGKTILVEALFQMDIDVKSLVDKASDDMDNLLKLTTKANGYMKLMDNLVIVYSIEAGNLLKDMDKIQKDSRKAHDNLNWNSRTYFTDEGQLNKKYSDDMAVVVNRNIKASLVSTKDGSKIAELTMKSEKTGEYKDYYRWDETDKYWDWDWDNPYVKLYDEYGGKLYLKFGDNSLVEAEAYFSSGFGNLEKRWEDFVNAFER